MLHCHPSRISQYLKMDLLKSIFQRLYCKNKTEMSFIMAGLDAVGKTAILYRLHLGKIPEWSMPTIGFNVEIIEHKNINFTLCDIGGGDKIKGLWHCYYVNCQGLIFIIDSTDQERINEAVTALANVLVRDPLHDAIILIFANKQDLSNAISVEEIRNILNPNIFGTRAWHIQPASAVTGQGLYEGLDWLSNEVLKKKQIL